MQGVAGAVERVTGTTPAPERVALHPPSAVIEGVAGELDDMEGVHHRDCVGDLFRGGGLESGEPVHRDHIDALPPGRGTFGEPGLEYLLRPAFDHVQQPGRARLLPDRGEVDDHGDVFVAVASMPPHVLVDTDRGHPIEPGRVIDQHPVSLSEDRTVRGMPRDSETGRGPRDGEVVDDDRFQRPPDAATRQLRSRVRCSCEVLTPRPAAMRTAIASHPDQERRGPMPERLVRETSRGRPAGGGFRAATATPRVGFGSATLEHGPVVADVLPNNFEAELVEAAEHGQVRGGEGSVGHVEVFRMASVRTPIIGGPRPTSADRHAQRRATPSAAKSQKTTARMSSSRDSWTSRSGVPERSPKNSWPPRAGTSRARPDPLPWTHTGATQAPSQRRETDGHGRRHLPLEEAGQSGPR